MTSPYVFTGLNRHAQICVRRRMPHDRLAYITSAVSEVLGLDVSTIISPARTREVAEARFISIGLFQSENLEIPPLSRRTLKSIGEYFGRDHTTVIYSFDTFQDLLATDRKFAKKVESVREFLAQIQLEK